MSQLVLFGDVPDSRPPAHRGLNAMETLFGELFAFAPGVVTLYTRKDGHFRHFAGIMYPSDDKNGRAILRSFFGSHKHLSIHPPGEIRWGTVSAGQLTEQGTIEIDGARYFYLSSWLDYWLPK